MLIKTELQNLPLSPTPAPTKKHPLTAGAAVYQLPKCGETLVLDVYEDLNLLFRFFTDGRNFITWREHIRGWTKRNPFIVENIRYHGVYVEPSSVKTISRVMGVKTGPQNVLAQVGACVEAFITRWHKQKKDKALDAKYRLMEHHLDMLPAFPADLAEFCENHVFHKSIVYLSKLEKGKRWGRCMHCGRRFRLDRSVKPGSEGVCPKCGFPVKFRGEWAAKPIVDKAKICIPSRVDGQLLLRYTDVRRTISPGERTPEYDYSDFFLNITVDKNGRQKTYAYYWRRYPYYYSG